jgi:hypothetical protein
MNETNLIGNIPLEHKAIQHDVSKSVAQPYSGLGHDEEYKATI